MTAMTDSDDVPPNDPIEDAWFDQDGGRVLSLAKTRLAANDGDVVARDEAIAYLSGLKARAA